MEKIRLALSDYWQFLLLSAIAAVSLAVLYTFRLGTLTHQRLGSTEITSHNNDLDWRTIVINPINAPYKFFDYIFIHLNYHSPTYARLSAVLFALIAIGSFYFIMYRWHGTRCAVLATILFATSGWLLHVGRLATGSSLLVAVPLALILFASWLAKTENHSRALLFITLAGGLALFTPGAIWFLIATLALYIRPISNHIYRSKLWEKAVSLIALGYFALILTYVLIRSPGLVKSWLEIPNSLPQPMTALYHWLDTGIFLFVRGPSDAALWLAHVPILDLFTSLMCLIGIYFYATHIKNQRSQLLGLFLLIGSLLVALQGAYAMSYVVPVVYLLAGTGLTYFLRQWLKIFPRNPIARGVGISLICLVVLAAAAYHVSSYFVAWRYSPSTVVQFQNRP